MSDFDSTKVICPNCNHQFRAIPIDVQLEGTHQRAEIERLQIALGQANADLMGCCDGALVRDLQTKLEHLRYELAIIGDMAVSDWNEEVVTKVDAVVPEAPPTYGERRRAELAEYQRMKTEIAELKAKLAQAEISALEWCKGLMDNDGHCTTRANDIIDIRIAKLKSKEIARCAHESNQAS